MARIILQLKNKEAKKPTARQLYQQGGVAYILASVSMTEYNLINLESGNRFTTSFKRDEMQKVIEENDFVLIENPTIIIKEGE